MFFFGGDVTLMPGHRITAHPMPMRDALRAKIIYGAIPFPPLQ